MYIETKSKTKTKIYIFSFLFKPRFDGKTMGFKSAKNEEMEWMEWMDQQNKMEIIHKQNENEGRWKKMHLFYKSKCREKGGIRNKKIRRRKKGNKNDVSLKFTKRNTF